MVSSGYKRFRNYNDLSRNTNIFLHENEFQNGCAMFTILVQPHCVNSSPPSATNMRQWIGSALVQMMAWCLFGAKPLSKPMLGYCQLDPWEQTSVKFYLKYKAFLPPKYIWKYFCKMAAILSRGLWVRWAFQLMSTGQCPVAAGDGIAIGKTE